MARRYMSVLDLSENRLTGEIPAWEIGFDGERRLDLSGNELTGRFRPGSATHTRTTWT